MNSNENQQRFNVSQQKSNAQIEDKVDKILAVLTGTIDGEEGLVSLVKGMHHCINDKDTGLTSRVRQLEKNEDQRSSWNRGVSFVIGILGIVVGWLTALFSGIFNSHKP